MLRNLMPLVSAFALLVAPAIAHAEEPTKSYPDCGREPTDAEVAAAKGAYQAGYASFNEADYARAIDYWEDAYRRDCTANQLLLNLARAYELAGRKRQAVVALETFLAREPSSGEKDQINRRVEVLKKKIAEEDAAAAAAPPPPTAVTPPPATTTTPTETPTDQHGHAKLSPWPIVVFGAGVVVAGIGGIGYLSAKNKADDLAKQCKDPEKRLGCPPDIYTQGTQQNTNMRNSSIVFGVGAAAMVGGAIWFFVDLSRVRSANERAALDTKPRLLPLVSPQFAGLSLVSAF